MSSRSARVEPAAPALPAATAPARVSGWAVLGALIPAALAAAIFVQRAPRPIEQGGDAYSDGNAIVAGRNFAELGFARLRFLPVIVPHPTRPAPKPDEYYTHYPPGADLTNGLLRRAGVDRIEGWRLVSAAFSLAGLAFWFLALRALFGDAVAAAGVATYALNFSFLWLGDAVHHYGYSDFLRSAAFYLGVRLSGAGPRGRETAALAVVLFLQSLLAFDYIPYSHFLLLGLGATGWKGERLRRLLLFAAMPVLGFGLHMLQNAWALGAGASLSDMGGAFLQRAFAAGSGSFERFSAASVIRHLIWNTQQIMGIGLGTILGVGALGAAAWAAGAPEGARGRAARVLVTMTLASAIWFVAMHQHAAEHPYSNRQLLPLASLALALGLCGLFALVSRHSRGLAIVATAAAALGLAADGYSGYLNDDNRRAMVSHNFEAAYARRADLPEGAVIATNIPAPAPPALAALLDRRVLLARSIAELEATYGRGAAVTYLFSPACPIDRSLLELLHRGRVLKFDEKGVAVEIMVEGEAPAAP